MASTATKPARMPKKEMEKFRRLLDEKKASLSAEIAKTRSAEEETTEESTQDIADKAVSSYTREFLYSLTDGERSTLLQIDDALGRIDDGTYGLCLNCGRLMADKRLTAVAWALLLPRLPGARREGAAPELSLAFTVLSLSRASAGFADGGSFSWRCRGGPLRPPAGGDEPRPDDGEREPPSPQPSPPSRVERGFLSAGFLSS